jgi:hypothetical protein
MTLTPDQVSAYLADPSNCPYCGSENIECEDREDADAYQKHEMFCWGCERRWVETWTPTAFEEVE